MNGPGDTSSGKFPSPLRRIASTTYDRRHVLPSNIQYNHAPPERAHPATRRSLLVEGGIGGCFVSGSHTHVPVTYERCAHVEGPFFHGTKSQLVAGAELVPGYGSNFHEGRVSNNIYFAALVETAAWGAELATALAGSGERGYIYVVEPLGPFEDDPNVTNKKFPGNPTQSYRTRHPLRVVGKVESWEGHDPDVLKGMLDRLALLREQGLDLIED
jgi:rifampin ADP-ribosylating transferase